MVGNRVGDMHEKVHSRTPSLIDVLCTLAANWARCVCAKEIKQAGPNGWKEEGLRLVSIIDSLNLLIPELDSPLKKAAKQKELAIAEAQSNALNERWGKAFKDVTECEDLFSAARRFCRGKCNIGDDELFNAALVRFRPDRLEPWQEPSRSRMSKIKSLLKKVPVDEWTENPWANPPKAGWRVSPEKLNSFIVRELRSEAVKRVVQAEWPTISKVARGLDKNKGTVSRLILRGYLRDNGLKETERRVDPSSVLEYCRAMGITYDET